MDGSEIMKSVSKDPGREARAVASALSTFVLAVTCLGLADVAAADEIKDAPRFPLKTDYSSAKDWFLKGENLEPYGQNPLYFPLKPGHKHVLERPDHPDGFYRKETTVLNETEPFDLPGIGKFAAAVVQEEEYMDGRLTQRAMNWFAMDKTTNAVYAFGEVSWEIDDDGKPVLADRGAQANRTVMVWRYLAY
jgi:hypothetical protein